MQLCCAAIILVCHLVYCGLLHPKGAAHGGQPDLEPTKMCRSSERSPYVRSVRKASPKPLPRDLLPVAGVAPLLAWLALVRMIARRNGGRVRVATVVRRRARVSS